MLSCFPCLYFLLLRFIWLFPPVFSENFRINQSLSLSISWRSMSCVSHNENGSIIQADFVQEISHKHHLQTGHVYTYSEISFCYRRNDRILRFKQCVDQGTMRIIALHGLLKEAQVMAPSLSGARQFTENRRLLVPMRNGRKILKTKNLRCFSLIRHRYLKCVLPQVSSAMNIEYILSKTCDYWLWSTSHSTSWFGVFESKLTTRLRKHEAA